ncbi:retrotransposon-derived protein PEG10 [Gracilinanus agilis]|uniref:retrotransposon-derived protein PEG10 n=1 Tax=Gracilinanus agilis TaxID=191870 RepID=UPI001CFC7AE3|nr:retrotransposon-derived protein PEG10 [Gracilinanus agilis]
MPTSAGSGASARRCRMEDLTAEVQALRAQLLQQTEENSSLQTQLLQLSEENATLRGQLQASPGGAAGPAAPPRGKCPVGLPEKFDGTPEMLPSFLAQSRLYMELRPEDFPSEHVRVCFLTSLLKGRAARWATPYLLESSPLLNNYEAFIDEFKQAFEDPQRKEAANRKIRRLRQGLGSVLDYASAFRLCAQDLDWNEPAFIDQFLEGLSDPIQDELARVEVARSLPALINQCLRIEGRLNARRGPSPASSPRPRAAAASPPAEAEAGQLVARPQLTPEERERRRRLNLCMYCGLAGHYVDNCPSKKPKSSGVGNSLAPL